ncbi:MAG TPA: hypothetical protein VND93_14925 [Myxococcales bacterium]|jgi:hypothetical protein|nr:hypothetical protein [Myxococcales bacterium]
MDRLLVLALAAGLGCASAGGLRLREGVDYGTEQRAVWVRGPWELVTPSTDIDEVIDQLCPAVMRLSDARGHDDGVEYCGLLYEGTDSRFYASAASPLSPDPPVRSRTKRCRMPVAVRDAGGVRTVEADFHSHPWPNSPMTPEADTAARVQRYSIRVQFDTTCHVLKFVPHLNEPVPGELFERVGRTWRLLRVIPVWNKVDGAIWPPFEAP